MDKTTTVPQGFAPSGLSAEELEHLASEMGLTIENHEQLRNDSWGSYTHRERAIYLLNSLGPVQRRCVLAEMIAHARLFMTMARTPEKHEATQMAAQMVITSSDWEVIGPLWEGCKDAAPEQVFRQCRVMPFLVAAYAAAPAESWHPEECIGWDGLCNLADPDDSIHSFAPAHLEVEDASVSVVRGVVGDPHGEDPLDLFMSVEIDPPCIHRDGRVSFSTSPEKIRGFAQFLLEQAEAAEAWAQENQHLFDRERQPSIATAGGAR